MYNERIAVSENASIHLDHKYRVMLFKGVATKNFQELTQFSPRSHPRHIVGKRMAQKDPTKDITR